MTDTPYIPREGTLPYSVIHFFRRNPEEALSSLDIKKKWSVDDIYSIPTKLKIALDRKIIARDKNTYTAGINLFEGQNDAAPNKAATTSITLPSNLFKNPTAQSQAPTPVPAPAAATTAPASPTLTGTRRPYTKTLPWPVDLATLPVLKKAFSATPQLSHGRKWELIYQRLTDVDDAIDVPIEYQPALTKSIQGRNKQGKGTFKVIKLNETHCRVGRIA